MRRPVAESATAAAVARPAPCWQSPWFAALIGGLCFVATLGNGFTYDDNQIVKDNPRIRTLTDFRGIWLTDWWGSPGADDDPLLDPARDRLYRPLTLFTFALNYAAAGLDPAGYHVVNVLLHALVCWLVFTFTLRLSRDRLIAAIAALLFAVHPIHAEAVAGIVGRAEVLAAALLLLGLLAILPRDGPATNRGAAFAAIAFFFALLSKETAICYPVLALAVLVHRARFDAALPALRALPLRQSVAGPLLIALLPLLIYFPLRYASLGERLIRPRMTAMLYNPLSEASTWERIFTPFTILGHYARLIIAPKTLSCDYGLAIINPPAGPTILTIAGLGAFLAITAAAAYWGLRVWRARQVPPAAAAADFTAVGPLVGLMAVLLLASYALISNTVLLIGVSLAERLFYWPSAPVIIAIAAVVVMMWRRHAGPGGALERARRLLPLLGVLLLVGLGARSLVRGMDWLNDYSLFLTDAPNFPEGAHLNVSLARWKVFEADKTPPGARREQLLIEADALIENALAVNQRYPVAIQQKALILDLRGRSDEARPLYELALQLNPADKVSAQRLDRLRGGAEERASRLDILLEQIEANPADAAARIEAGELLIGRAQNFPALQQFEAAVKLEPENVAALRGYGQALLLNQQNAQARDTLLRVVKLKPDDWETHTNLVSLFEYDNPAAALYHAERAAQLQPADIRVQMNLAAAYAINNRGGEAIAVFQRVLASIGPSDPRRRPIEEKIREIEAGR